jgi:hypothetical protein
MVTEPEEHRISMKRLTNNPGYIFKAVAITVLVWIALLLICGVVPLRDPWLDQGRIWPYSHVHLNEEYIEGNFIPAKDLLFISFAFLRNFISFAVGAAFLARRKRSAGAFIAFLSMSTFILYVAIMRASPMIGAWGVELLFAVIGAASGIKVGNLRKKVPLDV